VNYEQHIAMLAERHSIDVIDRVKDPDLAWARPYYREVGIPAVLDAEGYLTALHEIGHVVTQRIETQHDLFVLEREWAAWEWAIANIAFDIPLETTIAVHKDCFMSYFDAYDLDDDELGEDTDDIVDSHFR